MPITEEQQELLRRLPGVDCLMQSAQEEPHLASVPKSLLVRTIRETLADLRGRILAPSGSFDEGLCDPSALMAAIIRKVSAAQTYNLKRTINATGVVVHTNLGRSCLSPETVDHLVTIATSYSNLEFDLKRGRRGSRYSIVEDLLCEISGAEAAMVVNNNAAAVLLCLDTLARDKEVIISRGELVEIGGSFRIPDVMAKSGALLREVGTTNRTHLRDYQNAISSDTGLLLKVHTSNYSIVGFTASVPLDQMVNLGRQFDIPVMEDLGSGNFIDLTRYGLSAEPTVQASVAAGIDVVTFSGDKLLGGPQAGLIVGQKTLLDRIKTNPLTRALRIDKMTLAALEATLRLYRDERQAVSKIPTLRMLLAQKPEIQGRAHRLAEDLRRLDPKKLTVETVDLSSRAGGGALPLLALPSCCLAIRLHGLSANRIEVLLRDHTPPIIGRIDDDLFIMDPRTIRDDELPTIVDAFQRLLTHGKATPTNSNGDH